MMYCRNCGEQLADDAKFCPSCGATQYEDDDFRFSGDSQINNESNSSKDIFKRIGIALTLFGFIVFMLLCLSVQQADIRSNEVTILTVLILFAFLIMIVGICLIVAFGFKSRKK